MFPCIEYNYWLHLKFKVILHLGKYSNYEEKKLSATNSNGKAKFNPNSLTKTILPQNLRVGFNPLAVTVLWAEPFGCKTLQSSCLGHWAKALDLPWPQVLSHLMCCPPKRFKLQKEHVLSKELRATHHNPLYTHATGAIDFHESCDRPTPHSETLLAFGEAESLWSSPCLVCWEMVADIPQAG